MTEPSGSRLVPLTRMRAAIARRMSESKRTAPHIYLTTEIDMDALMAAVEERNRAVPPEAAASVTAALARAVALTLADEPALNAHWTDDGPIRYDAVHLGIAIALDDGLIAPALLDAESLDLRGTASALRDLAARARARKLRARELTAATFTLSNLGMFEIVDFAAIINPPQGAILATGRAQPRALVVDGEVTVRTSLTATLSADHRAIDGAIGARFLDLLKARLEGPADWLDRGG
jgi:pyruvate dehydrogenase E2 component (dihydrolipoamide acetyltransferase)